MVDGDDTYPAEAAPATCIAPLAADEADMAVGDRLSNGAYGEENDRALPRLRQRPGALRLIEAIYGYAFADVMTGYRAYNPRLRQDHARALAGLRDRRRSRSKPGESTGMVLANTLL